MISRSVICSSLPFLAFAISGTTLLAGTVAGRIRLVDSRNSSAKKQDFSNVVVWLTSSDASEVPPVHKHLQMLQKDKTFTPHILAAAVGTTVDFPNFDPIFHNAFSNFDGQIFDVALYPPGSSRSVRFTRPGIVRVFCNIHPSMSAIIAVVNSEHFSMTSRDGRFTLPNVSSGSYEIHFFHERATPETLARLTQPISVTEKLTELPLVTISEAGYITVGHKNKYGRDYPPNSDDTTGYTQLPR